MAVNHPRFIERLQRDPDSAVAATGANDVALLYWTAAATAAAISLGKDDAGLLAQLPMVERFARRALWLNESWDNGAVHVLHIGLAMAQAAPERERIAGARSHFERALALSEGRQATLFVTYAETVSPPTNARDEFGQMLQRAVNVDSTATPESRLANTIFQRRALAVAARRAVVSALRRNAR